jgi:hypothetical protein
METVAVEPGTTRRPDPETKPGGGNAPPKRDVERTAPRGRVTTPVETNYVAKPVGFPRIREQSEKSLELSILHIDIPW